MLRPKIITTLKGYSKDKFLADLIAGIVVGIVVIPLAIALAIASGVSPEKGLITAIIGGFIVSLLGGSRVQIGGPTAAFVVIIYGIIQKFGFEGLAVATIMAGVILVIMGLIGFGGVIKFIPYPVTVGFTSGIAVVIFVSQIRDFLGLSTGELPVQFKEKIIAYSYALDTVNYYALLIAAVSIVITITWRKISMRIPGSIVALLAATAAAYFFNLPVETIGSRFGEISPQMPTMSLPAIDFMMIRELIGPATTIAILAGIEALLSAVVADGMIGGKHRSNMELVAQGAANIMSPLFGGIPVTGAIARTATNIKNGGRTPIAGIVHAIVLLLVLLFLGKFVGYIPLACLAAILVVVAYNMSEWRTFKAILKNPWGDIAVLLTTFGLTIIFDLTIAIEIGLVASVFLFMHRMVKVSNVDIITKELNDSLEEKDDPLAVDKQLVPDGVEVYEINGPLFFGAAYKFEETIRRIVFV